MSDSLEGLRHKIDGASDLDTVVRSMKALAASSIGQYERSVLALADYYRNIELGLVVCLRNRERTAEPQSEEIERVRPRAKTIKAIVFGSDQGLVGQFNEQIADFVVNALRELPGDKRIWAVGDRVYSRLEDAGMTPAGRFAVPTAVNAITSLVGTILIESQTHYQTGDTDQLYLFHNRPLPGTGYEPVSQRLLPLDTEAGQKLAQHPWPTKALPEVVGDAEQTLRTLVGEYLFVSIYRSCAESLASENASRLAAMQRAEKNIDELVTDLNQKFRRLRQSSIDEELFEVVSGFESLAQGRAGRLEIKSNANVLQGATP